MNVRRIFTAFYLVLTVGVTWAAITLDRVTYPSWALVGPHEFGDFHHAVIVGVYRYLIPLALLSLVGSVLMLWLGDRRVSRALSGVVLLLQLVGGAATEGMAIPIQKQMDKGIHSQLPDLVQQLIRVDLYGRVLPGIVILLLLAVMTYQFSGEKRAV